MADTFLDMEDDPVEEVYKLRRESGKHMSEWRTEARQCYEFRDGHQWDSEDLAILEEQNRPAVTFNRCKPIIDAIVGYEMGNEIEVRYFPRTMGDREPNEVFSEVASWVRDGCDAMHEEMDALTDAITCGMGWTQTRVDYDEDPDGKIIKERVPPLEMRFDPAARKGNVVDAKWLAREKWVPLDEVKEKWPDKAEDLSPQEYQAQIDNDYPGEHDASNAWKYEGAGTGEWYDHKAGKILLIHYQYRERDPFYRVGDSESGRVVEFTPTRFNRLKDQIDQAGIPYVKQYRWVYKQRFVAGKTLLEEGPTPVDGHFSYHCITGSRDEEQGCWYGMMRSMMDPQRWANKYLSTAQYIFAANAKGGLIVEDDAVDDKRAFEDDWASPDGISYVNAGSITGGKIMEKSMGGYPAALDRLMGFAISSIRDVTGVNLEMLGMANREQAGVLEMERKKAALVILAPLMKSLHRYRKISGRALLSFIRRYIPAETVMRITDKQVPFWEDDETVEYDVVVDTAPSSPNVKTEVWQQLSQMLPALIKAGTPIPPDIIRFSPLPESVADEMINYIKEKSGQADPKAQQEQMQAMQQEIQKLTEQNKQLSDKRQIAAMQGEARKMEAQLEFEIEKQKLLLEQQAREMELAWKAKMSDADRAAKLLEIQTRYDTEMAKLQAKDMLERDLEQMKVVSIETARQQKEAEVEAKKLDVESQQFAESQHEKEVETMLSKTMSSVAQSLERLNALAEDSSKQRSVLLNYIAKKGDPESADIAKKMR